MHNEKKPMCAICQSYFQETSTVLQPGECVVLPYGTMLKCLSKSSDFSCDIKIRRCPNNYVFRVLSKWFEHQGRLPSNSQNTAIFSAINTPAELRRGTCAPNGRATGPQPPLPSATSNF